MRIPLRESTITQEQLRLAQRIIAFVQEQGFDVESLEFYRSGRDELTSGEEWKERRWGFSLSASPREQVKKKTPKPEPEELSG
jgi:hypothetical protein